MKKRIVFCLMIFVFVVTVSGQTGDAETEFWQVVGVDFRPASGMKLYLEKQIRYEKKFTDLESDLMEIGLKYSLSKLMDIRVDYRFEYRPDSNQKRNRLDANLYLNFEWDTFDLSNRSRIQKEFIKTLENKYSELEFRDRIRLTFHASKKVFPYIGGEIFLGLGDDARERNKLRFTAGTDWRVTKRVTVTLFYHYQKFLEDTNSKRFNILGCKFNYSF